MVEDNDPLAQVRAKKARLSGLLESAKSLGDAVPAIQRMLDVAQWEEDALSTLPSDASGLPLFELGATLARETDFMLSRFPESYALSPSINASATAYSSSGASAVFSYVDAVASIRTPTALSYAESVEQEYRRLQASLERTDSVRALVTTLGNARTLDLFDKAASAYASAAAGLLEPAAAALAMRTMIDAVKGDLWAAARSHPKENMTWSIMSGRLGKGAGDSPEREELILQEQNRTALIRDLSTIAKQRPSPESVGNLWARVLDHLDAVLGLMEPGATA